MFKKLILSVTLCISLLGSQNAYAMPAPIEVYNNVDSYCVAEIYAPIVNVRALPDEESKIIDTVKFGEEVEVVAKYPGWAKVCLAYDSYGFINDYFLGYKIYEGQYYPTLSVAPVLYAEPVYEKESPQEYYEDNEYVEESYQEEYYEPEVNYEDYVDNYSYEEQYEEEYYESEYEETYEEEYYEESYEGETSYDYSTGQEIVDYAMQYVGNPYVYGGNSLTNGVDCSGFTQQVFANYGISLDRTAASQSQGGQSVSLDDLQPGDLLFYDNGGYIGHVAIYAGDGTVVHASNERTGITVSDYSYRTPVSASRYW